MAGSHPCRLSECRRCRPGHPCPDSFLWERDEAEFDDPTPPEPALFSPFDLLEDHDPISYRDSFGDVRWADPARTVQLRG